MSLLLRSLALIACLFLMREASAHAATIQNIRGGTHPDKIRLVIELDQIVDFRVYVAQNPDRIVVELPVDGVRTGAAVEIGNLNLTELKQTTGNGMTTLSFMLKSSVTLVSAFMLPRDGAAEKPDRLVIDYKLGVAADPSQAPQILGTLPAPKTGGILGVLERTGSTSIPTETATRTKGIVTPSQKPAPDAPRATGPRVYTVMIDAGHGGKDPGAIGVDNIQEKNITLSAARTLANLLNATGRYRATLTRSDDRFILLPERVKIARQAKADLFISLHADMAAENHDVNGLSIYTLSDTASDAQTEKLAAQENKVDLLAGLDLSHEQEDVANILIDLAMRENMNQSRFFASKIVSSMKINNIDLIEKPHRYAGFAVLKAADIPSVLIEMGFLSNPAESRRLRDPTYQKQLMTGVVRGVNTYFDYLEKNARL